MTVNGLFEEARKRIAVPDEVLKEARKRRDRIRNIVEQELPTSRTCVSGSLAHGTQNDPLVLSFRETVASLGLNCHPDRCQESPFPEWYRYPYYFTHMRPASSFDRIVSA